MLLPSSPEACPRQLDIEAGSASGSAAAPVPTRPVRSVRSVTLPALLTLLGLGAAGCASKATLLPTPMTVGLERETKVLHESCDVTETGAQKVDVNGDGRADIVHVFQGQRKLCSVLDLNLDGKVDASVYYDAQGLERRRELDYDRDGRTDEIQELEGGTLRVKQRETNFDDKLDTWDFYEGDRLVRRERDSGSDGVIDQWWEFDRPGQPDCATLYADTSGDGAPDKSSGLDLCPPDPNAEAPAPSPNPSEQPPAEAPR
jgi:hypothetical protein